MRNRTAVIGAGLVLAFTLTGCTGNVHENATASESPTLPPASALPTEAGDEIGAEHGYDEHDLVEVPDEVDLSEINDAAIAAFEAYADKDQAYTDWFAGLKPHLYPSAVDAYATVQPQKIPVLSVNGDGAVLDGSTASYAVVDVPTDSGAYRIEMRRDDGQGPWLASRITPMGE